MKDPSSVRTDSRDEMICPKCYTEGLEEYRAFAGDYSGEKAKILKATRCPNTECDFHKGVPQEVIERQYEEKSLISRVTSIGSGDESVSIGSLIIYGVLGISLIMMIASAVGVDVMGLLGSGGQGDISGYVLGPDGEEVSNATVELVSGEAQVTTDADGKYVLSNVSYGVHTVRAYSSENNSSIGAVDQQVRLSGSGVEVANRSPAASFENGSLGLQLVTVQPASDSATLGDGNSLSYNFVSPRNLGDGIEVQVSPLEDTETTSEASVGMDSTTVSIPEGDLQSAEVSVTGESTLQTFSDSYRYTGGEKSVQIYGNQKPDSVVVELPSEANTQPFSERQSVADGESVSIDVSGDGTVGEVLLTLSGGQSSDPSVSSGVYRGTNPSISIDSESAPSTATLTVTGEVTTENVTDTGSLSGESLTTDVEGSIAAQDATIIFTGGQPENSSVDSQTISASGKDGDESRQYALIQDADNATYRLDIDHTISQNSNLVVAGYSVDGQRTTLSSGTESVEIDTDGGETIAIFITAEQEEIPESSYSHSGRFEIVNTEVSDTSIQPGGEIGIRATIENPSSQARGETIPVFKDGEQVSSKRVEIGAGGTKTVTFSRVQFNSNGVHTIEVSDGDPVQISVGDTSLEYGVGEISGDLVRIGDAGEVAFDTTGDGTFDCRVSAEGGTCDIGRMSANTNSFAFSQQGVTNTQYELRYTSQYGASGIEVDMNEDGQTDLSVPGVLGDGETVSERVTLDSGTNTFSFSVENGGDVPYEIAHTEADSVSRPTVSVNGRTIVNEDDTFKGERTYEVGSLRGGENTFTFRSASGDSYMAEIEWSEASSDTTPELYVDGDLACSKSELADGSCEIPQRLLDTGSVMFSFTDGADEFEYSVEQTARAVPTEVDVVVNNDTKSVSREEAVTVSDDGTWTAKRSISGVDVGENSVVLETQNVNGVEPNASGTVQYTYEIPQAQNPQLVVTNDDTTKNYSIQESALDANGYLTTSSTVVVPASEIVAGETTLAVASENGGGMNVQVSYVNETVPSSRVSDRGNETAEG